MICYGVYLYFDNKDYAAKATKELLRVARKGVLIGEIPCAPTGKNTYYSARTNFKAGISATAFTILTEKTGSMLFIAFLNADKGDGSWP